jgi:asparagine synthase (glutamine-hydrolysing)
MAYALAPFGLRRALSERRDRIEVGWLRPEGNRALQDAWAAHTASEPARWDRRVDWWARRRYLGVARHSLHLLAERAGAKIAHPLLDAGFLAALARAGGRTGLGDRTSAMRAILAGALPDDVLAREDKASFTHALWGPATRRFAAAWSGKGVDAALVDKAALRAEWESAEPDFRSAGLLQAARLASAAGEPE